VTLGATEERSEPVGFFGRFALSGDEEASPSVTGARDESVGDEARTGRWGKKPLDQPLDAAGTATGIEDFGMAPFRYSRGVLERQPGEALFRAVLLTHAVRHDESSPCYVPGAVRALW
jgi:hypothetical protein